MTPTSALPIEIRWLGRVSFPDALALQETLVEQRQRGEGRDTLFLLEHDPVYTIGRTRDQSSLKQAQATGLPVVEINRGGQATYHGPGQLVGYLVADLQRFGRDLHVFIRRLEQSLVDALSGLELPAQRRDGLTGVWIDDRKIASIGIGVRKWISMHGFALNVTADLAAFDAIVPCGLTNVQMTSVNRETGDEWTVSGLAEWIGPRLVSSLTMPHAPTDQD